MVNFRDLMTPEQSERNRLMETEKQNTRKFSIESCVIGGCTHEEKLKEGHLMCDSHFMSLSRDHQQQFYRARFKYETCAEGGEALLNAVMQTCAEAVEQVIADTAGNIPGVSAAP